MLPNVDKMGQVFVKLILARNSDLVEDITDYDGEDTYLLNNYVMEYNETEENHIFKTAEELGEVKKGVVDTVSIIGSHYGDTSCFEQTVEVVIAKDGTVWLDAEMIDEVFH